MDGVFAKKINKSFQCKNIEIAFFFVLSSIKQLFLIIFVFIVYWILMLFKQICYGYGVILVLLSVLMRNEHACYRRKKIKLIIADFR